MTTNQTIDGVPRACRECGSTSLTWFAHSENKSGVQEGRLRTHEVSSVFVLGCDNCSETLRVVSADKVAALLNKPAAQPQGQPVAPVFSIPCRKFADPVGAPVCRSDCNCGRAAPVAVVLPDLWQPIETAPKDGTEIILRKGDRVTSGAWTEWSKSEAEHHGTTGVYLGQVEHDSGALWASWDGGFCEDDHPTHWQPLPTVTPQQ